MTGKRVQPRARNTTTVARRGAAAIVVLAATTLGEPRLVEANVPSASSILTSVANRRASVPFTHLVVEGRFRQGTLPPVPVWEAIANGEARRVELRAEQETHVILTRGGRRWSFTLGEPLPEPEAVALDLVMTFYGRSDRDPSAQRAIAFVTAAGIDTSVVSLSRLERRIAYVLGARPWETDKAQLWIDKEHLVPIRFIHQDPKEGWVDMRLLGFGSAITSYWYPERIEIHRGGELQETWTYRRLQVNEPVDAGLFKPAAPG